MTILGLIRGIGSSDNNIRWLSENDFDTWSRDSPSTLIAACSEIIINPDSVLSEALAAAIIIKSAISHHWSPGFEQYKGSMWSNETKQDIKQRLLATLINAHSNSVTAVVGSTIALIGSLEYPDQWPELLQFSVSLLAKPETLTAGLILFKELLVDTIQERDFFEAGHSVLRSLFEASKNPETLLLSLQCFHDCLNFFLMGDDEDMPKLEEIAGQYVKLWTSRFCELIRDSEDEGILLEIFSLFKDLQSAFPDITSTSVPLLYEATFNKVEKLDTERAELISQAIGFLESCLNFKGHKPILKACQEPVNLHRLATFCIKSAVIPDEHCHLWVDDFNEFLAHELDTTTDIWPRQSIASFVGSLNIPQLFQQLAAATENQPTWRELESCLFLMCAQLSGGVISKVSLNDATISLLQNLLRQHFGELLLDSRLMIFSGYVASTLRSSSGNTQQSLELSSDFFNTDMNSHDILKASSLRTFSVAKSLKRPFLGRELQLLEILASLVTPACDETPAFLVEILADIIRLDFSLIIKAASIIDIFFTLVSKDIANIELNVELLSIVEKILDHLSDDIDSLRAVVTRLLSPTLEIIRASSTTGYSYSSELQFALDLANTVFEHCPDLGDTHMLLKMFFELVTHADDDQVLQSGSFAYVSLLEHAQPSSLDNEVIQQSLSLASKLLSPGLEDRAALASGRLVVYLLSNYSAELDELVTGIIVASVRRLVDAENALLAESLTQVLCKLLLKDAASVVSILAEAGLLEPALKKWFATFEVIRGVDEILDNVKALLTVYDLHESRIQEIMVDDEAIAPADMIITRSKSKNLKFTQISVPLKILRILIKELSQYAGYSKPADDDDDWDDEIDFLANGEARVDYRVYKIILSWFEQLGLRDMTWFQQLPEIDRGVLMEIFKSSQFNRV